MSANWLVLAMILQVDLAMSQTCLQTNGHGINFENLGNRADRLPSGSQAIITSYQFQCCGRVTRWQTYVAPGGGNHADGVYSIRFQVWRPGPAVESDGCYSLVGEDVYNEVLLNLNGLVNRVVDSSTVISVQPGDVVGYYVLSANGVGVDEGIQLHGSIDNDGDEVDIVRESVWYGGAGGPGNPLASVQAELCPFPVGPGGVLSSSTSAGPVLSIDIATSSCSSQDGTVVTSVTPAMIKSSTTPAKKTTDKLFSTPAVYTVPKSLVVPPKATPYTPLPPISPAGSGGSGVADIIAGVCVSAVLVVTLGILAAAIAIHRRKAAGQNMRDTAKTKVDSVAGDLDITTTANESYASNAIMASNPAYGLKDEDTRDITTTANESYASNAIMAANPAYGLKDRVTKNIATTTNESYATSVITATNIAYDYKDKWSDDRCHQTKADQLCATPLEDHSYEPVVYEYDYIDTQ